MKHFSATAFVAATASLLSSTAAFAELSAQDVWNGWKSYAEQFGQTVTATESMSGNVLTVSDVIIDVAAPEAEAKATLDQIVLTENADGTVTMTTSPEVLFTVSAKDDEGEQVDMIMKFAQTGMSAVAAEQGDQLSYTVDANALNMEFVEMKINGEPVDVTMDLAMNGLTGSYLMQRSMTGLVKGEGTLDSLSAVLKGSDPQGGAVFDFDFKMNDITTSSTSNLVKGDYANDMAEMLRAGFSTSGQMAYGATAFDVSVVEQGKPFAMSGTSQTGTLDFSMNRRGLAYGYSYKALDMNMSGADIPFPQLNIKVDETDFSLLMPLEQSDEPQDFGLLVGLKGLQVDDMIWSMFDPAAMLPRDPANLVIDLSGKAKWLIDILDEDAAQNTNGEMPGEVQALDINGLELTAAGASLTGAGALTFDNTDLTSYDGMPKPVGAISLKLTGGNTLLDTLVSMGLLPEDQAMGVRMMTGMFARPGDGDDTLISDIEMTEEGHVLANGQRLK